MSVNANIAYGPHPDMHYDEYQPRQAGAPLVIFWHGGSWKAGNKRMYWFVGRFLQGLGMHAFIVGYPKHPDRVFPGFIEDGAAAVRHIRKRFAGQPVILMGHSAGGHTALLVGLTARQPVAKVIALAAPCTLADPHWRPVFGEALTTGRHDPRTHVAASPPSTSYLLIHGRRDRIVAYSDSVSLNQTLRQHSRLSRLRLVPGIGHIGLLVFLMLGLLPGTRQQIKRFMHE